MDYRDTAQKICSKIIECANSLSEMQKYNSDLKLEIDLVGQTYKYQVNAKNGPYEDQYEDDIEMQSAAFLCQSFDIVNGIAVFQCIEDIEANGNARCISIGKIAEKMQSTGVESISKAQMKICFDGTDDVQVADILQCEPCQMSKQPYSFTLGLIDLNIVPELDYSATVSQTAYNENVNHMNYVKTLSEAGRRFFGESENDKKFHAYRISYITANKPSAKHADIDATNVEDAMKQLKEMLADEPSQPRIKKVTNITCDGKLVQKKIIDSMNSSYVDECDGGAAAGGDAGAAPAGDAGTTAPAAAGDTAAEMAGTTTTDVLGKCEPGKGYMGKDNFYIPARAKVPMHRWEAANSGSKRKKKGKYPYEKDMKVVVSMFEDDESALNTAYVWFEGSSKPEAFRHVSSMEQFLDLLDDIAYQANAVDSDLPSVVKCKINGRTYSQREIEKFIKQREDEQCSAFYEDDSMLNEFEDKFNTYEYLNGKEWEDVVADVKATGKMERLPEYERWEAAQLDAPEEDQHGAIGGCTIDEDRYKREYLKEFFIHGIYEDGEMFELGPMKRKVAMHYLDLHKLKVNDRAFQQMVDRGFSEIRTIGTYTGTKKNPQLLNIARFKDGFWLVDPRGAFKAGPFSNKQLARMYAKDKKYALDKGIQSDKNKTEEGYRLEYPTFSFSYTMAGVPCMDIVVAEDLPRAMKRFDTQWRMFDNSRPTRDTFRTVQDLQRDLSLLFIKDIEIEELTPDNVDEYIELAKETGNPSTIPELEYRCKNPKFKYILGTDGKTGRLVIEPFSEADDTYYE